MSLYKQKSKEHIDLPIIRINGQLSQWIENVFNAVNKKERVNKIDFLRECIMRGLTSIEKTATEKNLKIGYFKANTVDGIYFCGDFLRNSQEIMSLDKFIVALKSLEERQEIITYIGARHEQIYFKLVKEYGISHCQYFAKQDGEKVEYSVYFKNSETPFLRCFSESAYVAQQQAIAIYLDKYPEEAKRNIKDLAKDFKVKDKFNMLGEKKS